MTLKKEIKKITSTNKLQNLTQKKSADEKKKNECGCGCLVNQKK